MIWIVTSPERIQGEAAYLNALADAGPATLLLRKPGWDLHAYTSLLDQLHDHSRVMITAYPELLMRYQVMGLHVSEMTREAMMEKDAEAQPPAPRQKPVLSTSIHTPHSPGERWRYLLLGPVFDSISKTGHSGKGHLFHTVPPNSIAIGGVQASNIAKVKAMGFCGAALLGAIWQNPAEAVKNYQLIQQLWEHS